ncbi:hypothetical protein JCM8202_005130 [Rhodotorula sphaerocarpa]
MAAWARNSGDDSAPTESESTAALRTIAGLAPPQRPAERPERITIPVNSVGQRHAGSDCSSVQSGPLSPSAASSSSSSSCTFLPTFRSVQRSHFFQFCATLLLLFIAPLALLLGYKREFRSDAFALGVGAWMASETLRQIVFELLAPETSSSASGESAEPALAAEYEHLVLDDDPRDMPRRRPQAHTLHGHPPALPTVVYSLAQEALRLGVVAVVVRLLPTEAPAVACSLASSLLAYPPPLPSHPHPPHDDPNSDPDGSSPSQLPPLDPLFWSALWLALGWAGAEILWGSKRLWHQLELYRDVLPHFEEAGGEGGEREALLGWPRYGEEEEGARGAEVRSYGAVEGREENGTEWEEEGESEHEVWEQEGEFQDRLRETQREELEAQLGVPLFEVPAGIIFIWRLDSLLLALVFTLFLALPFRLSPPSLFHFPLWPTFALVCATHALLSYAWVARVRSVGIPSISYASLIVLTALTFAALGSWGVLV